MTDTNVDPLRFINAKVYTQAQLDTAVREAVESAAKVADQWAKSHSCDAHDNNPCCHVRTGAAIAEVIRASELAKGEKS